MLEYKVYISVYRVTEVARGCAADNGLSKKWIYEAKVAEIVVMKTVPGYMGQLTKTHTYYGVFGDHESGSRRRICRLSSGWNSSSTIPEHSPP